MKRIHAVLAMAALLLAGGAEAQVRDTAQARRTGQILSQAQAGQIGTPNYDVVLEVPRLRVDSIGLNVADLEAHIALDANAMNLVTINAGVDLTLERVQLDIVGVVGEAYVYVDLDNVTRIVQRVVRTLDNNPAILTRLLTTVDTAVSTLGGVANTALQPGGVLSQTVNTLGQTVQRTLDQTGNLVEQTLDTSGRVLSSRSVGNLLDLSDLRLLRETTNAAGQTVRQVQDAAGATLEYTLDAAGKIVGTRVVRPGR